jgi:hypothetical protein
VRSIRRVVYLYTFNRIDSSMTKIDLTALPTSPNFVYVAGAPCRWASIRPRRDPPRTLARQQHAHVGLADLACDICHVDAHLDGLTWDLSAFKDAEGTPAPQLQFGVDVKGPLTTQSIRALGETAPYHWRGEKQDLLAFNPAFVNLLERQVNGVLTPLPADQFAYIMIYMQGFNYRPNPREAQKSPADGRGARRRRPVHEQARARQPDVRELPHAAAGQLRRSDSSRWRGRWRRPPTCRSSAVWSTDCRRRNFIGVNSARAPSSLRPRPRGAFGSGATSRLQQVIGSPGVQNFNLTPSEADSIATFLNGFDNGLAPSTAFQITANAQNAQSVASNQLNYLCTSPRTAIAI